MTEWLYKATKSMASFGKTRHLAVEQRFLCRSAYEDNGSRADNVSKVEIGHIIHFYYVRPGYNPEGIGRFVVIAESEHPNCERFGGHVPDSALVVVKDASFIPEEYKPDSQLNVYTGWLLRLDGKAMQPPVWFVKQTATLSPLEKSSSGNQVA